MKENDKPDQGYENTIISAGIGTSFEQYKDVRCKFRFNASYDDLRTDRYCISCFKKTKW